MTKRKERKNERMNGWMLKTLDESRSSRGRNKEREEKGKS